MAPYFESAAMTEKDVLTQLGVPQTFGPRPDLNAEQLESRRVAYSYVRFSTAKQELGDSLRRQVAMAEDYCLKHNLELHPVSYRDLGVSAFKRANLEKGALAAFIDAVKTGKIAKGSYLVVEQFDRLSRAQIDMAVKLLLDLVHSGITLITLVDERVWDRDSIKDIGNLIVAIVLMSRANNESEAKAGRLRAKWGEKKKHAGEAGQRVITSECPRWLAVNKEKTGFVVLEDKVESIRKVFALRVEKGLGVTSIVSRANAEGWPAPGKAPLQMAGEDAAAYAERKERDTGWHTSLVGRLLKNRALLGEYQPHVSDPETLKRMPVGKVVLGYYPAVLDETLFLRAQATAERKGAFPGRRDASLKNWLQGLLRCTCGHSFVRKNKDSAAQPEYARYYCTMRNRGLSKCPGASAKELEGAVLRVVAHQAPEYFSGTTIMEELKVRAELLEVDVSAARQKRDRFADAIGTSPAPIPALLVRLADAEQALAVLEKELASVRAQLADLGGNADDVFKNIVNAVKSIDSLDARATLREDLSRIIEKVEVHAEAGYIRVFIRGSDTPVVQMLRPTGVVPGISFSHAPHPDYKEDKNDES